MRGGTQAVLAASVAAVTSVTSAAFDRQVLDLSGIEWTLTSPNFPDISVPGKVPSQVHLDLHAAQIIEDPLYALNEFDQRWVAFSNWTYTSAPLVPFANGISKWLVSNGLDTFATIHLCGHHVATTNNQFRQYYFDVSDILSSCNRPLLSINFGSAPVIANVTAALPGQASWPPNVQQLFEFPNREFVRKEQSDFGWDWGPAFAPAGIWQPAFVVQLPPNNIDIRIVLWSIL